MKMLIWIKIAFTIYGINNVKQKETFIVNDTLRDGEYCYKIIFDIYRTPILYSYCI